MTEVGNYRVHTQYKWNGKWCSAGDGKMEREFKEEWAQTETIEQTITND